MARLFRLAGLEVRFSMNNERQALGFFSHPMCGGPERRTISSAAFKTSGFSLAPSYTHRDRALLSVIASAF